MRALHYIIKHSESEYAINELGVRVEAREILQDWSKDFSKKASAKEAWHLCFSIKEEVNPHNISALQQSVQEVLAKNFYAYKYVSVIHTHQNNPHIHVLINKNNLFTHKKLHFQTREEIKNLFNMLREDFAMALNCNGNLNYHNAYRFEKHNVLDFATTLEKEKKQKEYESFYNKQHNTTHNNTLSNTPLYTKPPKHIDIMQSITHTLTKLEQKDSILQQKSIPIKEELQFLYETKKDLLAFLKECKEDSKKKNNKDKDIKTHYNYKQSYTYYKTLKDLKAINTDIAILQQKLKSLTKDSHTLQKSIKEHGFMQLRIKNIYAKELQEDFISLAQKKEYLQFLIKHRPTLTKEQIVILKDLQQELNTESKRIAYNLKNTALDSQDKAILQKLGLKTSSFSLIHAKNTITKTLHILERIDRYYLDTESLKLYETQKKTLQDNISIIDSLLEKKLMFYDDYFKRFQELEKEKTQQQTQNHKAILQQSKEQQDSQQSISQKKSDSLSKDSQFHSFTADSNTTHTQNLTTDSKNYDPYNNKTLLYNFKEFQALLAYFENRDSIKLNAISDVTTNHISYDNQVSHNTDSNIKPQATHTESLHTIESHNSDSHRKQNIESHNSYTKDSNTQQNTQQSNTQNNNQDNTESRNTLSQFHKDFIEWYIHSRDIRNKDIYRELLATQIQENTFRDYEKHIQDYKFHLYMIQKQKEKQELERQRRDMNR